MRTRRHDLRGLAGFENQGPVTKTGSTTSPFVRLGQNDTNTQDMARTVTDVNEKPTDVSLSNSTVPIRHSRYLVGDLSAADPDAGDTFTFSADDPNLGRSWAPNSR